MSERPLQIAVLASGSGTNLQAIIDRFRDGDSVRLVAVGSDNPGAKALERARGAGVETAVFERSAYDDRAARDRAMADWLRSQGAELVVLAGYMQLLSAEFIERFPSRVINVHPALLPSFPGLDAIGQAVRHGVRVGGVTVHFVDAGVDTGPIILQEAIPLTYTRPIEEFEDQVHRVEHRLLPRAIELIAEGAVAIDSENPRLVRIDER
jgi:phosphoribosylglycinamide formyltransferase-1